MPGGWTSATRTARRSSSGRDAEGAFEALEGVQRAAGPCDYSGMSYAKLRGGRGIQWPCNDDLPGRAASASTRTASSTRPSDYCETYGHDLATGAAITPEEYAASDPKGRAVIKGAEYLPPPEEPDDDYPFLLTTGRVTHHFHTRTKTGRAPALNAAAPAAFVELSDADAATRSASPTATSSRSVRAAAASSCRRGSAASSRASSFIPFHYGDDGGRRAPTAANRLTISGWDPGQQAAALQVRGRRDPSASARPAGPSETPLAGRRADRRVESEVAR